MMLIFRTFSVKLIDAFVNHPDIRATMDNGDHALHSDKAVLNTDNVILAGEGGAAVFLYQEPGVYDGHICLMKDHRGQKGLAFGRAAVNAMFTDHRAVKLVASIRTVLPAARMYVRKLGFSSLGEDGAGHELFVMEKPNG